MAFSKKIIFFSLMCIAACACKSSKKTMAIDRVEEKTNAIVKEKIDSTTEEKIDSTSGIKVNSNSEENIPTTSEEKTLFDFADAALLAEVLAQAKKEDKWIFMDIGAKWCVPCQIMVRDVYNHEETAAFFNQNFILYHVDGEINEGPDLRVIFEVNSFPTLMFLDEKGRAMMKIESALGTSALMELGKSALTKKNDIR